MTRYAIMDVFWDVMTGNLKLASIKVAKDRMTVCKQCSIHNSTLNICTICGCYLPFKTKLAKSSCPMGDW